MFKEIVLNDEENYYGSLVAHLNICNDSEVIYNYFVIKHKMDYDKVKSWLKEYDSISILMNIEVNYDYRNSGYGTQLMNMFLRETNGLIILIADISETDYLESWYANFDFETIDYHHGLPIMIKK